jgi:enamine deaminase RidA (YjgF/YER057c/UK114 family)
MKWYLPLLYLTLLLIVILPTPMFSQTFTNPASLFDPTPYGFSHVVTVPAHSQLILVAGQGGEENPEGKLSNDFRTQVQYSLRNIAIALQTKGITTRNIVKVTTLVVDHDAEKLQILIQEFDKVWPDKKFPINTLIPVPRLALPGMLVEIEAMAVKAVAIKE